MKQNQITYYGKIMLFGEYSVICDSMGLTIPFAHFNGTLRLMDDESYTNLDFARYSNKIIKQFFKNIEDLVSTGESEFDYNLEQLKKDINNGLYFDSTIPQGYGLGSSGALCASLFERYSQNNLGHKRFLSPADIKKLKSHFSLLESYFHGVSSGIDPLLSYIKYPLLIKGKNLIETVEIPRKKFGAKGGIFLIDTGKPGKTGPLVNLFLEKCENRDYKQLVENTLIPINNACVASLIKGEMQQCFEGLKKLSSFQLENFKPMIPSQYTALWREGLDTDDYYLKLCGSGGGGYILGFTDDYQKISRSFKKTGISHILVYKNS